MVSQRVIDECSLVPAGFGTTYHAQGTSKNVPNYLVNISLTSNVNFTGVRVARGVFEMQSFEVIIGMDIITQGDFAVTNVDGTTRYSFRVPSQRIIDFVRESKLQAIPGASKGRRKKTRRQRRRG